MSTWLALCNHENQCIHLAAKNKKEGNYPILWKETEEFLLFNYLLYSINVIQCQSKHRADNNVVKNATKCGAKEQRHLQYYNKYYPFLYQQQY